MLWHEIDGKREALFSEAETYQNQDGNIVSQEKNFYEWKTLSNISSFSEWQNIYRSNRLQLIAMVDKLQKRRGTVNMMAWCVQYAWQENKTDQEVGTRTQMQ